MKSLVRLFTVVVMPLLLLSLVVGCSGPVTNTKTLTSIAVTPASPAHLKVGATQQFTATGTFSDGTTSDITATVTWNSGTTATATISAAGLATGVAAGTTAITATQGAVTSTPAVTLTVISLTSIAVTPNPATVAVAGTLQFTATGTYSDASTSDISSQVTWNSGTPAVATISATGLATGVSNGGSTITATLGAVVSPGVVLAVGGAVVPVSLKVSPANPTIIVGATADFTAVELLSDGTTQPVPGAISWTSGTTATATILPAAGIATGLASGTSTIKATFGTLSGTSMLTVAAASARFVYTISPNDGVASEYAINAINASAPALAPLPSLVDPGTSIQLVFEPSGHFAYAAGFDGAIRIYSIDPVSGKLSASGLTGIPSGGLPSFVNAVTAVTESVVDPSGRYLYVVDGGTGFVNAFSINLDTTSANYGNLTAIASSPDIAAGAGALGIAVTPDGTHLYVTNSTANTISGYSIGSDGGLTPLVLSAAQFTTLSTPAIPAIDPTGQFLYVPNNGASTVTAFSITAGTGALTRIGATDIGTNLNVPFEAVTNPAGNFLFVSNSGNGTVAAFSIGGTGALTATTTANSGSNSGSLPLGIAIDPTGSFAAVANNGENTVTLFTLSAGALTPKYTSGSRLIPQFVGFYAGSARPAIGPLNVFAANSLSGNISGFTANSGTGALGTASPSVAQAGNSTLAADITGTLLYSTSASAKLIGGFSVTTSTAALTGLTGAPFSLTTATDIPSDVATEPSSRSVYVADTTGNVVEQFLTGTTLTSQGTTSFTSVNDIAIDPQGTFLIEFGNGSITSAGISGFSGGLQLGGAGTTLTQAGTWVSGAVDPTGQWVVALDSTGKTLQSIAFTPIQNSFLNTSTDGTLTATGLPLPTGLTVPSSVTFDPLGRFVFVSDATAGKIAVFTFNEATGVLAAAPGSPITVDATGTGRVSVDASGTYLYAAVKGNGGSVVSGVAAYKIGSTGTLTAIAGSPFATGAGTSGTAGVAVTSSVQ